MRKDEAMEKLGFVESGPLNELDNVMAAFGHGFKRDFSWEFADELAGIGAKLKGKDYKTRRDALRSLHNHVKKEYPKADERFIPNTFELLVSEDKKIADGVKLWDTIVAINDNLVNNGVDLSDEVIKYEVGDTITLTIIRKKKYIKVDIELQVYEVPV